MWSSRDKGQARVEPAVVRVLPPCQIHCPINEDIQRTNVLLSLLPTDPLAARQGLTEIGDYLFQRNPLFPVCGYVCGLCELGCNYGVRGGSIRRRLLKRFLAENYMDRLAARSTPDVDHPYEKVAIIGGGPAGLMAAYHLSIKGYQVSLFEASERLGGALWLIPAYRLPRLILQDTLSQLVRFGGFEARLNTSIGPQTLPLNELFRQDFKAVFIGRGSPLPRILTFDRQVVEGQDLAGVMFGHDFLYEVSRGELQGDYLRGKKVIVVGGGNVALDAVRTARRLGGEASLVCLECEDRSHRDGIPADRDEVRGAWEEGVYIHFSRAVQQIVGEDGHFKRLVCPRCVQVFDDKGFNPECDLQDVITLDGDILVIAVGQGPEHDFLQQEGLLDSAGKLRVDEQTMQSHLNPAVFLGGDMRHLGYMVEAMRDGLEGAESIHRFLRGQDLHEGRFPGMVAMHSPRRRQFKNEPDIQWVPPERRLVFDLYEKGFTLEDAVAEAHRCLACGPCQSCKACVSIGLQDQLPTVQVDVELCSGCGVCLSACHYQATQLEIRGSKKVSFTDQLTCKGCGQCVSGCPSRARSLNIDPMAQAVEGCLIKDGQGRGR